jgi:hypothetical protein
LTTLEIGALQSGGDSRLAVTLNTCKALQFKIKVIKQEIFEQIGLDRTFEDVANKKACVHAHQMSIIIIIPPACLTKCLDPRC